MVGRVRSRVRILPDVGIRHRNDRMSIFLQVRRDAGSGV